MSDGENNNTIGNNNDNYSDSDRDNHNYDNDNNNDNFDLGVPCIEYRSDDVIKMKFVKL